jgi:aminoglycoside phosphotransferase (APT) family kinase protein
VVIDWTNAEAGAPEVDLAMTWLILAPIAEVGHAIAISLLEAFVGAAGHGQIRSGLPAAAQRRLGDPNLSDDERSAVRRSLVPSYLGLI